MKRLLITFLTLAFTHQAANACTCAPVARNAHNMREVAEAFANSKRSSLIFVGRVTKQEIHQGSVPPGEVFSMTEVNQYREVTLSVSEGFRGTGAGEVKVTTNINEAGCGVDFHTGQEYLVYATKLPDGSVSTNLCSGTQLADHAGPALRQLRGQAPAADDLLEQRAYLQKMYSQWNGNICGHVYEDAKPAGKVSVSLTEIREDGFPPDSYDDENLSKADGSYCVQAPPGKYRLSALDDDYDHDRRHFAYWPAGVDQSSAQVIELKAGQRTTWYDLQLQPQDLYRLMIRLITSDGSAAPEHIGVFLSSVSHDAGSYQLDRNRPENGIYYFAYVPPGEYVLQTFPTPDSKSEFATLEKLQMPKVNLKVSQNMRLTIKLDPALPK